MKHYLAKIVGLIAILCLTCCGVIFYLDSRIPRATATVQVLPSVFPISPVNNSSSRSDVTHKMTR